MNCPICFKGMTEHQFLTVSQYYCDTKGCMHCTYPLELTHEERLDKLYPAALPSDWPKPLEKQKRTSGPQYEYSYQWYRDAQND